MANIARLGVTLGLETATFQQGIASAKKSLSEFAAKIPAMAAAGAAAFTAMAYKSMSMADQIADLSDATDVSVSKVLQFGDAMRLAGGKMDDAGKALLKFSENIDTAAQGSKQMQDAFARVGVSLDDLRKLSTEDLFQKAVNGISKMDDAATRTGAKMDLFGKAMRTVDMTRFADEVEAGAGKFDKYESGVKAAADLTEKLENKSKELSLTFTKEIVPALDRLFDAFDKNIGLMETAFKRIGGFIDFIAAGVSGVGLITDKINADIDFFIKKEISQQEYLKRTNDIYNERLRLARIFRGEESYDPDKPGKPSDKPIGRTVTAGKDAEADKMRQMLLIAQKLSDEYERELQHTLLMQNVKNEMAFMTENERKLQEAVNQAIDQTSKKIEQIQKQKEAAAGRGANEKVLAEYDEQIKKIEQLGYEYSKLMLIEEEAAITAQRTFSFGWNKAFAQYAEDAYNYATQAKDMFNAITGVMANAIDAFVETGKFAFKDFAVSIIKELLKIEMKLQAMQLFDIIRKGISSFVGGGIGTSTTEVATALPVDFSSGISSIPMAANGGTINSPTIVGERGPELFIPGRSGAVIPNNRLEDSIGGATYITNNYIDAIDTKSFEERIYGSSRAIWSANQFASKSISNNRSRT